MCQHRRGGNSSYTTDIKSSVCISYLLKKQNIIGFPYLYSLSSIHYSHYSVDLDDQANIVSEFEVAQMITPVHAFFLAFILIVPGQLEQPALCNRCILLCVCWSIAPSGNESRLPSLLFKGLGETHGAIVTAIKAFVDKVQLNVLMRQYIGLYGQWSTIDHKGRLHTHT